tara:strand:+ start:67072 stop:67818 length:747 start_codon:yes stop_codon:yes gene_type:complete
MSTGYMWAPAIAIVLTKLILKKKLDFHFAWNSWSYNLKAIAIPFLYCILIYGVAYAFGLVELNLDYLNKYAERFKMADQLTLFVIVFIILKGFFGTIGNLSSSFGEELGWRGYLYPKFRTKYSFVFSSIVVGLIWSIWHWPLILKNTLSNPDINSLKIILLFTVVITLASFIYSWLFEKSRSVWSAVILHSAHNSIMGGTFDGIFNDSGYYVGETGIITMIVLTGFAIYYITNKMSNFQNKSKPIQHE